MKRNCFVYWKKVKNVNKLLFYFSFYYIPFNVRVNYIVHEKDIEKSFIFLSFSHNLYFAIEKMNKKLCIHFSQFLFQTFPLEKAQRLEVDSNTPYHLFYFKSNSIKKITSVSWVQKFVYKTNQKFYYYLFQITPTTIITHFLIVLPKVTSCFFDFKITY